MALILRGGGGEGRGEKVPIGTERKDERKKKRECMQMCFFFTLARADNPFITCNAEKEKRKEKEKFYQYFIPTPPFKNNTNNINIVVQILFKKTKSEGKKRQTSKQKKIIESTGQRKGGCTLSRPTRGFSSS